MTRRGKRPSIGNPSNFLTVLIKMILMLGVGIVGGLVVDDYFKSEWHIFTIVFGIMGLFIASFIYRMYKETINGGDEEE